MRKANRKTIYVCDVCSLRFPLVRKAEEDEREILCPRCRTPFVRPVSGKSPPGSRGVPRCMAFS